jgi:hypothetical protein
MQSGRQGEETDVAGPWIRRAVVVLAFVATPGFAQTGAEARRSREIDRLSAEVDRLEATRAIRTLQRAYGYFVDRALWQEAADLFADDGTIELGADGVYVGKGRIHDYLKRLGGGREGLRYGQLNEHMMLQPVVDVAPDGRSAKARWRDWMMLGQYQERAEWGDGIMENSYIRDGGVWKIASVHLFTNFVVPYEAGWARAKPAPADWRSEAAKAFPPDRPPTVIYRPFPEPYVPAFHAPAGATR